MNSQKVCRWAAMTPGVRRIPAPMVLPIVTAMPKPTPRTTSSCPREIVVVEGVAVSMAR